MNKIFHKNGACITKSTLVPKMILVSTIAVLAGCSATQTALEYRNLSVQTRMSETIYLEPVSATQKTVYVSIKNTSDKEMDINPSLHHALTAKGYKVVSNPQNAHYLLQGNILQAGVMDVAASKQALGGGFGSALIGAGTGATIGALTGNGNAMLAGGLAGGIVSMAADSLVKNVNYTLITDIQIRERAGKGVKVNEQFNAKLKNGSSGRIIQTSSKDSNYNRYTTRIVSNASQVNLKFETAKPALSEGLTKSIAGIF